MVNFSGNFPAISDDLVNSYHLLLCCIDWFYSNAIMSNRSDLTYIKFLRYHEILELPLLLSFLSFNVLTQLFFLSSEICIIRLIDSIIAFLFQVYRKTFTSPTSNRHMKCHVSYSCYVINTRDWC